MTASTSGPTSVDLTTDLAGLALATPVLTASGCGGTGRELAPYLDLARLGAFTTRTITLDPRPGSPGRRVVPTAAGVLRYVGRGGFGAGVSAFHV